VVLMGPSGCGKSTLLNLLGGLDQATEGRIWIKGQPLENRNDLDRYRASEIGFVFQSFNLLTALNALENVEVPMLGNGMSNKQRTCRAQELLHEVGLDDKWNVSPRELSMGEQQRVAIARALANMPSIILADEPTGNLDSATTEDVLRLFVKLHQALHITFLIATHDLQVASHARAVLYMKDGMIVEGK